MSSSVFNRPDQQKLLLALFWVVLMAIALGLRLPNLGGLGLWGDEGYTAIVTNAILDYGYPNLPSGRIYLRSLPFLYLEALSAKIFGLNEFALRLPSLVVNLGSVWMTYFLGKRLFGQAVGLTAAVMMVFSSWQIEFSRYARMYALFQFLYLASVYVFYRGYIEDSRIYRTLIGPVWLLTFLVHELGVVLVAILVVPFLRQDRAQKKSWMLLCGSIVIGLAVVLYANVIWILRFRGSISLELWSVFGDNLRSLVAFPPLDLVLTAMKESETFIYALIIVGIVGSGIVVKQAFLLPVYRTRYLYLISIIVACFFHQIGLAATLLFLYTVLFKDSTPWRERPFVLGCGILLLSAVSWILYGLLEGIALRHVLSLLFQYPYVYERFLKFSLVGWPLETALAGLGMILIWRSFLSKRDPRALFAGTVFIGPLLLLGMIARGDDAARYSFHLFPMMLILSAYCIVYACKKLLGSRWACVGSASCLMILCIVPSDLQLTHALNVSRRTYNWEIDKPLQTPGSGVGYAFHPDYKSTSDFIKNRVLEGDWVISMLEVIPFYYLEGKIDYLWTPKDTDTIPLAPGTGVVPKINFSDLQSLLAANPGKRIWLLEDPVATGKLRINKDLITFLRRIEECTVYKGRDDHTSVLLLSSNEEGQAVCFEQQATISNHIM